MKILGLNITRARDTIDTVEVTSQPLQAKAFEGDIDTIMRRLHAVRDTLARINVTPETCMEAPTVQAIVQAVSRRLSVSPVTVYLKTKKNGRDFKQAEPSHPVAKLLQNPNPWQTQASYWLDATSRLLRYGNYFAWKYRGSTGPIRMLQPLYPTAVTLEQDKNPPWDVTARITFPGGQQESYPYKSIHHARGPARDTLNGDSPVYDVREAIALEIAAERFGAQFFGNGAMPFLIFKFMTGFKGWKTEEDETQFINDFQATYSGTGRMKAMVLPPGMEMSNPVEIQNDKNQFLDTRRYQRTVIAGAWGVPPHLVGDLERGTFNNVEQQDLDFTQNVILPFARMFESAMERDLLTREDITAGYIIRFNLDATLRGDFKGRQEGLRIQKDAGIINTNEWRERENMNPIGEEEGGEDYTRPLNTVVVGSAADKQAREGKPEPAPTSSKPSEETPAEDEV